MVLRKSEPYVFFEGRTAIMTVLYFTVLLLFGHETELTVWGVS